MVKKEVESIVLKVASALVLNGKVVKAGSLVEVSEEEAKDLLRRGKAVLAEEKDAPPINATHVTNTDSSKVTAVESKEVEAPKADSGKHKTVPKTK